MKPNVKQNGDIGSPTHFFYPNGIGLGHPDLKELINLLGEKKLTCTKQVKSNMSV